MRIRINNIDLKTSKVVAIKLTRLLTGWGLKESKDFVEDQKNINGKISLTLHVNMSLPHFVKINSFMELVAMIEADRFLAPLNDSLNIESLDAVDNTRPTIASLTKELGELKQSSEITSKAFANKVAEVKCLNDRISELYENYRSCDYQKESSLNLQLAQAQERINKLEDALFCQSKEISSLKNKTTEIIVNGTKIIIANDSITYMK